MMMRMLQHHQQQMMHRTMAMVIVKCQGKRTITSAWTTSLQRCWNPTTFLRHHRSASTTAATAAASGSEHQVATAAASTTASNSAYEDATAQRRAYQYYYQQQQQSSLLSSWKNYPPFSWWKQWTRNSTSAQHRRPIPNASSSSSSSSLHDMNMRVATYLAAVVMGALGATYASVPLYKLFCQATGFGGTTQRVQAGRDDADADDPHHYTPSSTSVFDRMRNALHDWTKSQRQTLQLEVVRRTGKVHTWTDEDAAQRLASLQPVPNAQLITVRMDSTVGDVLPWTFEPTQRHVKVVPGETALTFFRVTNHADHPIVGVATYNVYPPKMGLYFNKIQCFCFEEQRVLAGETVDMPVFFFIDPDVLNDGQMASLTDMTLSYTFFPTDMDDDDEDDDDDEVVVGNSPTTKKAYA